MPTTPVIAVIDVGKTNKKLLLFDEDYNIVFERSARIVEIVDEDGDPCEDLKNLHLFVFDSLSQVFNTKKFDLKALNFSAYGASLVNINDKGNAVTPLYNYLKSYPEHLKNKFYQTYGGEEKFSSQTASPVLGSLNSGMQLYRLKHEKPELFRQIKYALHLPQYLSYLICNKTFSDITSIGCHTNLWDFRKNEYHEWVYKESIEPLLAPIVPYDLVTPAVFMGNHFYAGAGLHDSSAALIPYLANFQEPFVLLSTGTWCISLNPFNDSPLTIEELQCDCLCYLQYQGKPVKASRLFAGQEHEEQTKRIAAFFDQDPAKYSSVEFHPEIVPVLQKKVAGIKWTAKKLIEESLFATRDLSQFSNDIEAYHQLVIDMMERQVASTLLVLKGSDIKRIFVDGGFSRNLVYMNLLASAFPGIEIFAASIAQATALGAALAIHKTWNKKLLPNTVKLQHYSLTQSMVL